MTGNPFDILIALTLEVGKEPENVHRSAHELLDINLARTTIHLFRAQARDFEGLDLKRVEELALLAAVAADKDSGDNLVREYIIKKVEEAK